MRMRTTLLLCLLSVSLGFAALSLLVVRSVLQKQIRHDISLDIGQSIMTFQNMQTARRETLRRETALLADLPSLKSLMTTEDGPTIRDGGGEFYRVSGADFFALADRTGKLVALYDNGNAWDGIDDIPGISDLFSTSGSPHYFLRGNRLYEISSEPLYFGSPLSGSGLGYVAIGYAIDDRVAREVSEAADAGIVFAANGMVAATTLDTNRREEIARRSDLLLQPGDFSSGKSDVWLGHEHYLQASIRISRSNTPQVRLLVLKSYDEASKYLKLLNRLLIGLGAFVFVAGGFIAVYISGTITSPLEALVAGTRALGSGNFKYRMHLTGAKEIRELSIAFERMRVRLQKTQQDLIEAERLATIGRMASSISHDLRHYLATVYANAEFLGYDKTTSAERVELLAEVRLGVQGMTELVESLLVFSRTGQSLNLSYESVAFVAERAATLVRKHPDAQHVAVTSSLASPVEAWFDASKIERAVYNLLLNACQAAQRNLAFPAVNLSMEESDEWIKLLVTDNGTGVPESIRVTLFQPFVSEGKQSGIGLGLTIAKRIAEEHGGNVVIEESENGKTVFSLLLAKSRLREFSAAAQESQPTTMLSSD